MMLGLTTLKRVEKKQPADLGRIVREEWREDALLEAGEDRLGDGGREGSE